MIDTYNRQIDYMRISITDRCNLRCKYCMPDDIAFVPHSNLLSYEEFLRLVNIFAKQGIRKIKVTGGEPLVRLGCPDFIRRLKEIEGIENVTITTNGVLLDRYLDELIDAGVDGMNISLDTLNRDRYAAVTGRDEFDRVWQGISDAVNAGLKVKLNCVPISEYNAEEIPDFFELARTKKIDVRFIEMMPIGHGKEFQPVSTEEILEQLKNSYDGIYEIHEKRGNGPATYYEAKGFAGCVGFIGAVHQKFCSSCNRIRLTSEGFLKLCLYYSQGIDLRKLLREGADDDSLAQAIREAIAMKPQEHHFSCQIVQTEDNCCDAQSSAVTPPVDVFDGEDVRNMSQIGG